MPAVDLPLVFKGWGPFLRGLAVQAASGARREEMKRVADFVLRAIRMA